MEKTGVGSGKAPHGSSARAEYDSAKGWQIHVIHREKVKCTLL